MAVVKLMGGLDIPTHAFLLGETVRFAKSVFVVLFGSQRDFVLSV